MAENKEAAPLVSIIVPCYNGGKYLAEALDSVLSQTYSNWECIILDDGSTDNSREVASRYTEKDKRFKYIYQANKGLPSARNEAIRNGTGKYILPVDADDKISSRYVEEAVSVFQNDKDVKLVYCKAVLFGQVAQTLWQLTEYSYKRLLVENVIFCSAMYRRSDYEKANGYDEKMTLGFEDWEFWISLLNEKDKVICLPDVHFYYRIKEASMRLEIDRERQKKIRIYVYDKHKDIYDKYLSIPTVLSEYYLERIELAHKLELANYKVNEVLNSTDYRLGKFILAPARFFKNLFR